jgi:hypothetical protein
MAFTYDLANADPGVVALSQVRLLLNDVDDATHIFEDAEITAFLTLEGDNVKRAAAQAIDTNADDQALALKVLRDHEQTTDGAKLADALRKRAAALRAQADRDDELSDDGAYFEFVPTNSTGTLPELTGEQPSTWWL